MDDARSEDMGPGSQLPADNDPAFHRRYQQRSVKPRVNDSKQGFPRAGDIAESARRIGGSGIKRCEHEKKQDQSKYPHNPRSIYFAQLGFSSGAIPRLSCSSIERSTLS